MSRISSFVGLDGRDVPQRAEGLVGVLVDAGADTCALGCAYCTVGLIQVDGRACHTRQRLREDAVEEHVGIAGVDVVDGHAHVLHDVDALLEREHDAFMGGTDEMGLAVDVEVDALDRATDVLVLKDALCTVAERYDVSFAVDPAYSRIDQIYVLRKSMRKSEWIDIDENVVWRMVEETIKHLERPWSDIETRIKEDGVII